MEAELRETREADVASALLQVIQERFGAPSAKGSDWKRDEFILVIGDGRTYRVTVSEVR
jgi:hypothetical protein